MWTLHLLLLFLALSQRVQGADPEINMTTPQQIQYWGYPAEIHHATTSDGFILEMHRIPYGKSAATDNATRPIVFMQHGLLGSSSHWIDNLPNQSAGFVFADAGFDVWLGNIRGNTYSNSHIQYNISDSKFWEWTWDEMAKHDLQTMIEYALSVGGQQQVYYIGHSQGTLTMFAKLSEDQDFSKKIRKFFALAPVARSKNMKGLFPAFAHLSPVAMYTWYNLYGSRNFLPNSPLIKTITKTFCDGHQIKDELCSDFFFSIGGPEGNHWNDSRVPVYAAHNPAGTSSQNMLHWIQMINRGTVSRFDYGPRENKQHYGSINAPAYNFSTIQNEIYLYWGDKDYLGDPTDIKDYLLRVLPASVLKGNVKLPDYNHFDFTWGLGAANDIYEPIIQIINTDLGN